VRRWEVDGVASPNLCPRARFRSCTQRLHHITPPNWTRNPDAPFIPVFLRHDGRHPRGYGRVIPGRRPGQGCILLAATRALAGRIELPRVLQAALDGIMRL